MSTYLFGDVQGCWPSLKALLEKINYNPAQDRLGFVGDVVNSGKDSLDVIRFIMGLENPYFVLGNHEIYFLITALGFIPRTRYEHTLDALLDAPDCKQIVAWLLKQPLVLALPEEAGLMVHAGIPPQWTMQEALKHSHSFQELMQSTHANDFLAVCFGDTPAKWSEDLTGFERMRYIVNACTRMRYSTSTGELDLIEKNTTHANPDIYKAWFKWREPDGVPLFFGHWAALQGQCNRANTWALDTGCVYGKQLTAIALDSKQLFQQEAL